MSRLYYDQEAKSADVRVSRTEGTKGYLEKVAKLVPSEVLAAYMTMIGLVSSIRKIPEIHHFWIYIGIVVICLPITIWYLLFQAEKGRPKTTHIIVSTFAFIIWAYAISGHVVWPQMYDTGIASIILVLFSLISGKIPLK
jgi:hypothetical protein